MGNSNERPKATPNAGLHPKKVMLSIWWDYRGVLYYELLLNNETINSEKCFSKLDQLMNMLKEKRPEFVNRKVLFFIKITQDTTFLS